MPPEPREGDVVLLVGTMKGAFLVWSDAREQWRIEGPHFRGSPSTRWRSTGAAAADGCSPRREHALGRVLRASDDFGATWTRARPPERALPRGVRASRFNDLADPPRAARASPTCSTAAWSRRRCSSRATAARPGPGRRAARTRAPAAVAAGRRRAVPAHDRPRPARSATGCWSPCRPAASTAPTTAGESWRPRNIGVRAEFLPDKYPEFGQCVHKVVHHPARPERLFLQNHWGLYRSDDWGDSGRHRQRRAVGLRLRDGRCTRTTPTRSTSCRSSRTSSAASRRRSCASTARATRAARGSR